MALGARMSPRALVDAAGRCTGHLCGGLAQLLGSNPCVRAWVPQITRLAAAICNQVVQVRCH